MIQLSALAISTACLSSAIQSQAKASEQQALRIHVVDYPRPVSAAVLQIEKHFGWVVTYEDTPYVHPSQIVDITAQVRRDGQMSKRVFGMRRGSIDITYTPRQTTIDTQVGEAVQQVLLHSRAAGNIGEFSVDWVPGGYHVVPLAVKGKSGVTEPQLPLLDTRITLPYREEDGLEIIMRWAEAISTASGHRVHPGTMPMNRLARARVPVEAQNDRARDILWRALQSIGPDLSWQLLCDVGENGSCAINIHIVPKTR
jgi:hypothetical protein